VAFEVAHNDTGLAAMRAAGIAATGRPDDFPACHCFAVKDPDGNDLSFHRRKSQP